MTQSSQAPTGRMGTDGYRPSLSEAPTCLSPPIATVPGRDTITEQVPYLVQHPAAYLGGTDLSGWNVNVTAMAGNWNTYWPHSWQI